VKTRSMRAQYRPLLVGTGVNAGAGDRTENENEKREEKKSSVKEARDN